MKNTSLTNAEYAVLGLLVEGSSHGYELERKIEDRGMRDWTEIGFSSIYFVLGKLEKKGCVTAHSSARTKSRKTFTVTPEGIAMHKEHTYQAIAVPHSLYPSLLLGLANWPSLEPDQPTEALSARLAALVTSLDQAKQRQIQQAPMPFFVAALFEYSINQLEAEISWVRQMIDIQGDEYGQN